MTAGQRQQVQSVLSSFMDEYGELLAGLADANLQARRVRRLVA
jgi:hypothetical protein